MKKIAIPVNNGLLAQHFGHCQNFAVYTVDNKEIKSEETLIPPVHEPGAYPHFLADKGISVVICGGMGHRARQHFNMQNIEVITGATGQLPQDLINLFLENKLETGTNPCDH
ncbi:MAG: NifB/NifX family molybdenum-iron cluster-binding protein [Candidatus Cloacimonetes bacterium]|nr:NifB/NifX family molybdenum-iron cluster-binding protein [Candidatus Cloacimonadota bacterium]